MRVKFKWIFGGVIVSIGLVLVLGAIWSMRASQLAERRADDLRPSIQKYLDETNTVAGQRDPEVMAQVSTGNHLRDLIQYRCLTCDREQVATQNYVASVVVLQYSEIIATAKVRWEWGWHDVDPNTGRVISPCHAQAATRIFILTREQGVWKVSDFGHLEASDVNPVDDSPELRAKYCSSN